MTTADMVDVKPGIYQPQYATPKTSAEADKLKEGTIFIDPEIEGVLWKRGKVGSPDTIMSQTNDPALHPPRGLEI